MNETKTDPRDLIRSALHDQISSDELDNLLDTIDTSELLHAVFLLTPDEQRQLLSSASLERAAHIVEDLPDGHAAELMEEMPAIESATILEELASDHRVDILSELDDEDSEAILELLDEDDAREARELIAYPPDVAGGLMMTEFASFPKNATVREVVDQVTGHEGDYEFLTVHYIYVVVRRRVLVGVIRLRDLVFSDPDMKIGDIATKAMTVAPDTSLLDLDQFFADHDIAAVPVVNERKQSAGHRASQVPARSAG